MRYYQQLSVLRRRYPDIIAESTTRLNNPENGEINLSQIQLNQTITGQVYSIKIYRAAATLEAAELEPGL
jgi:hypothetical protein